MNKSDIEDNLEDLQRNNHDTEHAYSNSNDSNADSDHDNQVEASKKTIGKDIVKNLVSMVNIIKQVQRNHGILLKEILQRLRNKGTIVPHPEGMPQRYLKTLLQLINGKMFSFIRSTNGIFNQKTFYRRWNISAGMR
ncbi:uncharacterized protein LOC114930376 [Nylanderia fulva]|uniref:uncharacterized protein LOC114930376 n=1 Tax=Nylanderia fulva TaxID=613905 RepID=UPI0010FB6765|nr:uncharacterized protein LOC114930376 [Nylanderia fulva]